MKITLLGAEFNRIMRICGPALDKRGVRECLGYIEIQCDGQGVGCATACDSYTLAQTRFRCKGDKGTLLIRPFKTVRNDCTIEITDNGEEISISDGAETLTRPRLAGDYINHAKICNAAQDGERKITVAFSPKLLQAVAKSHSGREVYFDIYGPNRAVVLHSDHACGLLLPIKINRETKEPEFWNMEGEQS